MSDFIASIVVRAIPPPMVTSYRKARADMPMIGMIFDYGPSAQWCKRFVANGPAGRLLYEGGSKKLAYRAIHANKGAF